MAHLSVSGIITIGFFGWILGLYSFQLVFGRKLNEGQKTGILISMGMALSGIIGGAFLIFWIWEAVGISFGVLQIFATWCHVHVGHVLLQMAYKVARLGEFPRMLTWTIHGSMIANSLFIVVGVTFETITNEQRYVAIRLFGLFVFATITAFVILYNLYILRKTVMKSIEDQQIEIQRSFRARSQRPSAKRGSIMVTTRRNVKDIEQFVTLRRRFEALLAVSVVGCPVLIIYSFHLAILYSSSDKKRIAILRRYRDDIAYFPWVWILGLINLGLMTWFSLNLCGHSSSTKPHLDSTELKRDRKPSKFSLKNRVRRSSFDSPVPLSGVVGTPSVHSMIRPCAPRRVAANKRRISNHVHQAARTNLASHNSNPYSTVSGNMHSNLHSNLHSNPHSNPYLNQSSIQNSKQNSNGASRMGLVPCISSSSAAVVSPILVGPPKSRDPSQVELSTRSSFALRGSGRLTRDMSSLKFSDPSTLAI